MAADSEAASSEKRTTLAEKSNADLDRVTDFVEEQELDSEKVAQKMSDVLNNPAQNARLQRDKELNSVKVRQEDVELVMSEMEMDKKEAERALKENRGDVVATLRQLVN